MGASQPDPDELGALRQRMLRRARGWGYIREDAEEIVQEAFLKLARERPGRERPPLPMRAFRALRDKRSEFERRKARQPEAMSLELPDAVGEGGARLPTALPDATELLDVYDLVVRIAGPDALAFAVLRAAGSTEADIAKAPGWSPHRAAAARVRLGRAKRRIVRALIEPLSAEEV